MLGLARICCKSRVPARPRLRMKCALGASLSRSLAAPGGASAGLSAVWYGERDEHGFHQGVIVAGRFVGLWICADHGGASRDCRIVPRAFPCDELALNHWWAALPRFYRAIGETEPCGWMSGRARKPSSDQMNGMLDRFLSPPHRRKVHLLGDRERFATLQLAVDRRFGCVFPCLWEKTVKRLSHPIDYLAGGLRNRRIVDTSTASRQP